MSAHPAGAARAPVRVTTAREAAARDAAAIAAGTASSTLMRHAGERAAAEILRRYPKRAHGGVAVFAGTGNNGGDGWVVARVLASHGHPVRVIPAGEPRTPDAAAAQALAIATRGVTIGGEPGDARLVVDALLGTGAAGTPRDGVAALVGQVNAMRGHGAVVVSLDVPSGVDADAGPTPIAVHAHLTLAFGTMKRGLLLARDLTGVIAVLDIGLGAAGDDDGAPELVSHAWVRAQVPRISAHAHKGTRRKLAIVGGQPGMAGAAIVAARAAMRSGIGMVRLVVARESLPVVQAAVPYATAAAWPARDEDVRDAVTDWADTVLIGPGLGDSPSSLALAERVLGAWRGPVVADADALNVFKGEASNLGTLLAGRPALITPHPAEAGRLLGVPTEMVNARRFEIGAELAAAAQAAVLLKGVPTVITDRAGVRRVCAAGTAALAAAGSGDLLAGIAATMLAQTGRAAAAGAIAAWVHGHAAELATDGRTPRGITLEMVERALSAVWALSDGDPLPPVLAELPAAP
ncbi:MAG TPA: NAD(P)H-hydrate dehydratase [Gemmatimonadaceae bacterium]|nr:NAD(P)H-hydrate dehydratase [Gemmatimonadaceae bacterium]